MNKILRKQIGRNIKTYVDDTVVKIKSGNSHHNVLRETFVTLSKYDLKINPTKCTFGVESKEFLGGIEANPHKVEVVLRLAEPRCIKDIQCLKG